MTDDLEAVQVSLKRLLASKDADRETQSKALLVAMHGIQAALAELIESSDRAAESAGEEAAEATAHRKAMDAAAERIATAVRSVKVEVPAAKAPVVNVPAPVVNVAAPQVHIEAPPAPVNHITVAAPSERARPARYEVDVATDRFGVATGKMIITPIYE